LSRCPHCGEANGDDGPSSGLEIVDYALKIWLGMGSVESRRLLLGV
jgi:hypothetical protein